MQLLGPARIYFLIFGLLTIAGGVMGYVKVHSTASLIAGAISGLLLLVAAWLIPTQPVGGLALAAIVSLLLVGYFLPKFLRTGAVMPAGLMSVLAAIGLVLTIVAWLKR